MKRFSTLLPAAAMLLALPLTGCQTKSEETVCVDVARILTESNAAKKANEHLAEVQKVLQDGLMNLQGELQKNSAPTIEKDMQQASNVLNNKMAQEQAAAREVVLKHMNDQINAWKSGRPNAFVRNKAEFLAIPDSADITADIISRMNKTEVTFAELPTVSIQKAEDAKAQKDKKSEDAASQDSKAPAKASPKK